MGMAKYRKKPVVVEAVKWTGKNREEILQFVRHEAFVGVEEISIPTLEGIMIANAGDYIIKGVHGEFYPCKPDIFAETYEPEEQEAKWIHRDDMDFIDKYNCTHFHGMCTNCGLVHDFIDGHTGQYKYCPQCGRSVKWE